MGCRVITLTSLVEESAFGSLLEEIMKFLQLAPPHIFAYEQNRHNGDECWYVKVDVDARQTPTPGRRVGIRATGGEYKSTVELAVQQTLEEIANIYGRELVDTPYLTMVEAMKNRAKDLQLELDAVREKADEEKSRLQQKIKTLEDQIPRPPADGRRRGPRIRITARKRMIRHRVFFRIDWHDPAPIEDAPPVSPASPAPPAPARDSEEEDPEERDWDSSDSDGHSAAPVTQRPRFTVTWLDE